MALPTPPTSPGTVASPQLASIAATKDVAAPRDRYPSPAPTEPSSPVLESTPRMPGIAAALSDLPPIPPYNPHSARQQQKRKAEAQAAAAQASASTSRPRPASAVVAPAMTTPAHAHRSGSHMAATASGVGARHGATEPSPLPPHLAAYAGRQRVYFGPYLLLQTLGEGCVKLFARSI